MVTFACFSPFGNHPSLKHLVANTARTLASGSPHAFRKLAGRSSMPGAFHDAVRLSVSYTSSGVTSWLMLMLGFIGMVALSRGGAASELGKKRCRSRVAFS